MTVSKVTPSLTRYRKRCEGMPHRNMQDEDCIGSCFEPDDTLQQIADAAKHRIYIDANGTDPDSEPWVSFDGSEVNGLRHCFDNVEIEYVLVPAALLESDVDTTGLVSEAKRELPI